MESESKAALYRRISQEVFDYLSQKIEVSEQVFFSQYRTIKRIYKFRNRDLTGTKLNEDLSYNYYFDIISPRAESEIKNLSFDTRNILVFSQNPIQDFAAVFILNAKMLDWMVNNGEDIKLKEAVEEYTYNGNIGFKRTKNGYDKVDARNTYITNPYAETVDDTNIIERHLMTASELRKMTAWEQNGIDEVIKNCGDKFYSATELSTETPQQSKRYEVFEYTGEVSEKEFNEVKGIKGGDENKYFLAKVVIGGLQRRTASTQYRLFAEKLPGKMSDWYIYAHRGAYEGRFWRIGMIELLFDHQVRANEIGNDIAQGLSWASKTLFSSKDTQILQNIRTDLENGDIVVSDDIKQVQVVMQGMNELLADWNRLMEDADTLSNSTAVSRGELPMRRTAFQIINLINDNTLKMYAFLRLKFTLPYRRVFREWILPNFVQDLKGEQIFRLLGDEQILDQFREIYVNNWYMQNLVQIGPHDQQTMEEIKAEKLQEIQHIDPVIENAPEIWKTVLQRLYVTISGENYKLDQNLQDMTQLLTLERDPNRINFLLDSIYTIKGIPVPPRSQPQPQQGNQSLASQVLQSGQNQQQQPQQSQSQPRQARTPQRPQGVPQGIPQAANQPAYRPPSQQPNV